jgi:predicted CXXCH cytochrome family protein
MAARLILLALTAFGAAIAVRAADGPAKPLPVRQADIAKDFVGSDSCRRCHEAEHDQWARSLHVRMTKPAANALIVGDFNRVSFAAHGRAYRMDVVRDGRRTISVSHGGRPPETFDVHYTLGAKRFQGYLTTLPDGRLYVLPVFWHVAQRRWVDWKEITPVPDGDHDLRQIWNVTCFNCHATNLDANFDVASKTYRTTWTEMGLACEACHGPGRPHIALMEEWEARGKPAQDAPAAIFAPRRATPRQVFDMCAYCHGNKNNVFLGFLPGERMEEYALPFLVSEPMPADDPQGDFWPDGRPSRFNRPQALTLSGCFIKGNATCTNCHVAHGSRQEHSLKVAIADSDRLCTQCHTSLTAPAQVERHTHHPAASRGSRCIDCHMSDVNWRLLIRRRDHTFAPPVPEMTAAYGVPNGCTTCHDDRPPEWASAALDRWYGNRARRAAAMRVADTFYLAGAGDPDSLPGLASLAVDRSRGMLVRASAAEFIGRVYVAATGAQSAPERRSRAQTSAEGAAPSAQRPRSQGDPVSSDVTTRVVNALIGAINDPEPAVRAVAVRSLGVIADRRGMMPIVSRLQDDVRTVRAAAAEALLWMGVATLPGAAGEVLARAQDEYGASLSVFPDLASSHAVRGWLETERGRHAEAERALDLALSLEPGYARAHVYRGIVDARAGRFDKAIERWETAKSLEPTYPNIDRLIEEARRRRP